ncbi:hypothetical protein PGT21_021585 [Puccinia graminis f. sp. tritici]|uniref:Uncharacterized protein n=1 Tax=Puccinia graminis f. sp. tritici TaxID=56615 RepID=A0A5B0QE39_PUCGR|nr:hypothetical protein PGT21_021585 [Puccinia graminis f. sp. tritici]KAA1111448.1 hypothetical protein PGTUg99_010052 [Puccinia graminis f. sp. tritici]
MILIATLEHAFSRFPSIITWWSLTFLLARGHLLLDLNHPPAGTLDEALSTRIPTPELIFDLNQPPPGSSNEVLLSKVPPTEPITRMRTIKPPTERTSEGGQPSSVNQPTSPACQLLASVDPPSESITPGLTAQDNPTQDHSRSQEIAAVDGLMVASETSRPVPDTGTNHKQPKLSCAILESSQQSKRLKTGPSETKLPVTAFTEQANLNDSKYGLSIIKAQVVEELLHKHSLRFNLQIKGLQIYHRSPEDTHTSLPFARFRQINANYGKVFRVLNDSKKFAQANTELSWLYNHLIASLYKLHGDFLSSFFSITTLAHRIEQEKLLAWLDKSIFSPVGSPPILGLVKEPYLLWRVNDHRMKFGPIQLELIMYFSQNRGDAGANMHLTTFRLLKAYQGPNLSKYSALTEPPNLAYEEPSAISIKPHFKEALNFISNLAVNSRYQRTLESKIHPADPDYKLFMAPISDFQAHIQKVIIHKAFLRSYHPKIPIIMFFSKTNDGPRILRITSSIGGSTYDENYMTAKLRSVLKSVDFLHVGILERLKVGKSEFEDRREKLLQYIIHQITKPADSLPLIGTFKSGKDVAPWFDKAYQKHRLFGEMQLKLIECFSGDVTLATLVNASAFLIANWYHDNHLEQFNLLSRSLQK